MPFSDQFGFFEPPYACLEPSNNNSVNQDRDFNNKDVFTQRIIESLNSLSQEFPPLNIESRKGTECANGVVEQCNSSIFKSFIESMFPN